MTSIRPAASTAALSTSSSVSLEDQLRQKVAAWAVKQANDPNVGYDNSSDSVRFGQTHDGKQWFDCSGLVYSAYKAFGVTLGASDTAGMGATASSWSTRVDKEGMSTSQVIAAMKPGDLIIKPGHHVAMYTGNGQMVEAKSNEYSDFSKDVVTTDTLDASGNSMDSDTVAGYLSQGFEVLRPNVNLSGAQMQQAVSSSGVTYAAPSSSGALASSAGSRGSSSSSVSSASGSSGTASASGTSSGGASTASGGGASSVSGSGASSGTSGSDGPADASGLLNPAALAQQNYQALIKALAAGGDDALRDALSKLLPSASAAQLAQLASVLKASPSLGTLLQANPSLLPVLAKDTHLSKALTANPGLAKAFAAPEVRAALQKDALGGGQLDTLLNYFADVYLAAPGKQSVSLGSSSAAEESVSQFDPALLADIEKQLPPRAA